jgi:hypothetical protein
MPRLHRKLVGKAELAIALPMNARDWQMISDMQCVARHSAVATLSGELTHCTIRREIAQQNDLRNAQ